MGEPAPEVAQPLPQEVEQNFEFELPHAGERYVYAVNTENDSVAVIDADTLGIQSVEAGDQPTFLQTLAGTDAAIALNVGTADATLIRTAGGKSNTVTLPVQSGANAIAVAPDGQHAVVYFNANYRGAGSTGSYQDISVLFLQQGEERAVNMAVGFRPSSVAFSADGNRAFVITEDGVSVLDFEAIDTEGADIAPTIALGDDANESLDVSITPDGRYALARRESESVLRLVDLESGELHLLDLAQALASPAARRFEGELLESSSAPFLPQQVQTDAAAPLDGGAEVDSDGGDGPVQEPSERDGGDPAIPDVATPDAAPPAPLPGLDAGPPPEPTAPDASVGPVVPVPPVSAAITDVDLAPSGAFALAVVRDQSKVLRVEVPDSFLGTGDVTVIDLEAELVGSVNIAPDSEQAFLYTTAVDTHERVSLLDIESGEFRVVRLPKAVQAVTLSADSKVALIVHKKLEGSPDEPGLDPDTVLDRSHGYSVLDLDSGFSKLQTTQTSVGPSVIVPDGSALFLLFNDSGLGVRQVHRVALDSFAMDRTVLGSPPVSIGAVPGSQKVFVGQEHPDGRIAFIDWQTGALESVTGFELNSRIRE